MSLTQFSGPVQIGNTRESSSQGQSTVGMVELAKSGTLPFNTTLKSEAIVYIDAHDQIFSLTVDVLTVFNSATSATLTMGLTSGATTYVSGVDVKTAAGRLTITYTAAQLLAMVDIGVGASQPTATVPIFITITSVGQPTAGSVRWTLRYAQPLVNWK